MGKAIDDIEVIGLSAAGLANTTNATTSYVDVTGAAVAVEAITEDPTQVATYGMLRVTYSAIVSKATGTSATLGVYANGAIIADTETVVLQTQGAQRISGSFLVARADAAAQTVKLQVKSADTSIATVTDAYIDVERYRIPGGVN